MDATPSHTDNKEKKIIHDDLKKICLQNKKNYKRYKKWCDEYFYLPHRKELEVLVEYFLIMNKKIGLKILSL